MENKSGKNSEIVLVTGGHGFLGQHVIRLLQENDERVKEIRVVDIKPFSNRLGFKEIKPIKSYICDIAQMDGQLITLFKGVDCVIHIAALSGYTRFPPLKDMERVNVEGTRNVIRACLEANVPRLVFTSTAELCIPNSTFVPNARETLVTVPPKTGFLFKNYCSTKFQAECLVKEANGKSLANGGKLKTVSIRPTLLYGELDPYCVTTALSVANQCGGKLRRVGGIGARLQVTYAGNAAWAHVLAKDQLGDNPDHVAKKEFFITDDTITTDIFSFVEPFLKSRKMSVSSFGYPFYLIYVLAWIISIVSKVVSPFFNLNTVFPEPSVLVYIYNIYHFCRLRATLSLGYKPIYTPEEAYAKSMSYYSTVPI